MISHIPFHLRAAIAAVIFRILRRQRPKTAGGIQVAVNRIQHPALLRPVQHGERHGKGPDLVASDLFIRCRAGKDILQIAFVFHIELFTEGSFYLFRQSPVIRPVQPQFHRQHVHDPQRVIPIRIDLHGLAVTGCGQDTIDTDVHPGHLVVAAAGENQTVRIHTNAVVGTPPVAGYDMLHGRPCLPDERTVSCPAEILPNTIDQQQSCINRVVHGLALPFREKVGHKAVFFIDQECPQNTFCFFISAC